MSFNLTQLAAFAAATSARATSGVHTLTVEEARARTIIKDGNKKPAEDGSQALTLICGRVVVALDAIAKGATRVNAAAEQVEAFRAVLQSALDAGEFDAGIAEAQKKSDPANRKPAKEATVESSEAPEGVDLDAIEADTAEAEVVEVVDTDELG